MSRRFDQANRKAAAQIAKLIADIANASTDHIVRAIDIKLMLAGFAEGSISKAQGEATAHRLDAAHMMLHLRGRVEGEGTDWWKFYANNFTRSRRDAMRLLKMAGAADPVAALEHEREQNRVIKREARATDNDDVCHQAKVVSLRVVRMMRVIEKWSAAERRELWSAIREKYHGEDIEAYGDGDDDQGRDVARRHQ